MTSEVLDGPPHEPLDLLLEALKVVAPLHRRVDVCRAVVVRVREQRDDRDEDRLHAEHGPPAQVRRLALVVRVVAGRVQDRDADLAVGVDVRVPHLRAEGHRGRHDREVLGKLERRAEPARNDNVEGARFASDRGPPPTVSSRPSSEGSSGVKTPRTKRRRPITSENVRYRCEPRQIPAKGRKTRTSNSEARPVGSDERCREGPKNRAGANEGKIRHCELHAALVQRPVGPDDHDLPRVHVVVVREADGDALGRVLRQGQQLALEDLPPVVRLVAHPRGRRRGPRPPPGLRAAGPVGFGPRRAAPPGASTRPPRGVPARVQTPGRPREESKFESAPPSVQRPRCGGPASDWRGKI
ncbi:unnamed protein product [Pelagomonas calceolata]|uniref:Uncharacterized protein n=1 Tax=Pelagomonas calceolata TaxID=35677 RepID=A0A8J2WZJ0_9STRA|nr:unnamed protein product [Pelagomonas calceolata]